MSRKQVNEYRTNGAVVEINISTPSHPCAIAQIDISDLRVVIDGLGRWGAHVRGCGLRYVCRTRRDLGATRKMELLHRAILGLPIARSPTIDHHDRDGFNNRKANLRVTDAVGNGANSQHGRGSSRFKGVFRRDMKGGPRWRAGIMVRRKMYWLGTFNSESEAAKAYDIAAIEKSGEFALLNSGGRNVVHF